MTFQPHLMKPVLSGFLTKSVKDAGASLSLVINRVLGGILFSACLSFILSFRQHFKVLLYNFSRVSPILFKFSPHFNDQTMHVGRNTGAERLVLQELCHFVIFTVTCLQYYTDGAYFCEINSSYNFQCILSIICRYVTDIL